MPEKSVRDLDAWNIAMDLVAAVYQLTKEWPREELYGLTSQILQAVVSVPSNIAEGRDATRQRTSCAFSVQVTVA